MMNGFGYDTPTAWDAAQRRREMAAADSQQPATAWGPTASGGQFASSGNAMLDWIRNQAMADATARTRGLRSQARTASPNDPALAAWAGLQGQLGGQGEAARSLNAGAFQNQQMENERAWQEYMARLRHRWEMEMQKSANNAALWGTVGNVGGTLGGAFLGGL